MFEYSVDLEMELTKIVGSHEILIPGSVQNELKILANKGNGKRAQNARAALKLIQKFQIIPDEDQPVDDNILLLALELHAYVVTNDKELRHRLREKHIGVIYLRGKQKLEIDT
jgi:rRNA-processing protein FCF1